MGIEKWIFIITIFLMVDTYYDRKYTQWLLSGKKYYQMLTICSLKTTSKLHNTYIYIYSLF